MVIENMKKYLKAFTALIILLVIAFFVFSSFNKKYALKINNENISVAEFQTYLYEQKKMFEQKGGEDIWETDFDGTSAQEVAKQNAINSLVTIKTAVNQAPKLNIYLTADEENTISLKGREYFDKMKEDTPFIELSQKEAEKIVKEGIIQNKVYDFVTRGFEMSNADFESYFNKYYEENKKDLNDVKIRYIFKSLPEDEKDSEAVFNETNKLYERILLGEDFVNIQAENSDSEEKNIVNVKDLNFSSEVEDAVYSLKQGEVSDVIYTELGFYIIKAETVVTPDMNELKDKILNIYTEEKKQEIYQAQIAKWSENISIEKNENIWNSITIEDI